MKRKLVALTLAITMVMGMSLNVLASTLGSVSITSSNGMVTNYNKAQWSAFYSQNWTTITNEKGEEERVQKNIPGITTKTTSYLNWTDLNRLMKVANGGEVPIKEGTKTFEALDRYDSNQPTATYLEEHPGGRPGTVAGTTKWENAQIVNAYRISPTELVVRIVPNNAETKSEYAGDYYVSVVNYKWDGDHGEGLDFPILNSDQAIDEAVKKEEKTYDGYTSTSLSYQAFAKFQPYGGYLLKSVKDITSAKYGPSWMFCGLFDDEGTHEITGFAVARRISNMKTRLKEEIKDGKRTVVKDSLGRDVYETYDAARWPNWSNLVVQGQTYDGVPVNIVYQQPSSRTSFMTLISDEVSAQEKNSIAEVKALIDRLR